jgi:hypothetical protein
LNFKHFIASFGQQLMEKKREILIMKLNRERRDIKMNFSNSLYTDQSSATAVTLSQESVT